MQPSTLPRELAIGTLRELRALVGGVGRDLVGMHGSLSASTDKSGVDVVTKADHHSEARLVQGLAALFPSHRVAAEEGTVAGPADSPWVWHVDPLDGTANYSRGLPTWAISVGLAHHDQPVLGLVLGPACGVEVYGAVGLGAWSGEQPLPAASPADADPKRWIVASDWPWDLSERKRTLAFLGALAGQIRQYKTFGSAAVDLALVCRGQVDAYAIPKVFPWDLCGGCAVAAALGFDLLDWDGAPWSLRRGDIICARPGMRELLVASTRAASAQARP